MRLRWSAAARRHLLEARAFIAADNAGAARAMVTRIDRTAARIMEFPLAGEALPGGSLRATTVPGTAYRLIYVIERDMVLIVALWHGARQWPPASS